MGCVRSDLRKCLSVIIISALLTELLIPITYVSANPHDVYLVSYSIRSSAGEPEVYPGSKNVNMELAIKNNASMSIYDVQACFYPPQGFTVRGQTCVDATALNGTKKKSYAPGELFRVRTTFDIDKSVKPGRYFFEVHVFYTLNGTRKMEYVFVPVDVKPYPPINVSVIEYWWGSYEVYPGTTNANLNVLIKNVGNVSITGGDIELRLPKPFKPRFIRATIGNLDKNATQTVRFSGIDIPPTTKPGKYNFTLRLNVTAQTDDGVQYSAFTEVNVTVEVKKHPPLLLKVVNALWSSEVAYPHTKELTLRVTIQNLDISTINSVVAKLHLPKGFMTREGKDYVVTSLSNVNYGFGDVFTLTFQGINVSTKAPLNTTLRLDLRIVGSYRGASFIVNQTLNVTARLVNESAIVLITQEWLLNGRSAEALPSSRGLTLSLTLLNLGTNNIVSIWPKELSLPKGFILKGYGGTCLNGVRAGGTCTIQLNLDISKDLRPDEYLVKLYLGVITSSGNTYMYSNFSIETFIGISPPTKFKPVIILGKAWWGRGAPETVFSGQKNVPIHIEIDNVGRWAASNVYVTVSVVKGGVKLKDFKGLCSTELRPGTSCTFTTYADISNNFTGNVVLKVLVNYTTINYNSFIKWFKEFKIVLPVVSYVGYRMYGGVTLVSWGWESNYPVFPGTQNATYSVTIANHYPYRIEGIEFILKLPKGIKAKNGTSVVTSYVAGPVNTDATATTTFTLTIPNTTKPGIYYGVLKVKYVISCGGPSAKGEATFKVPIQVNSIERGIEFVASGWVGASAAPMTYGNKFYFILRNTDFPSMRGVVATLYLPKGIVSSVTNSSVIKLYPTSTSQLQMQQLSTQATSLPTTYAKLVASLVTTQAGPQQPQTGFTRGDFLVFTTTLNVLNVTPGTYYAWIKLTFIDNWGVLRVFRIKVPIVVLGSSKVVKVWALSDLRFVRRSGTLRVALVNVGSSPIYNVYVAIYPVVQYITVSSPIKYFNVLLPNKVITLELPAYFNPIPVQGGAVVTYGNMPFRASIMYTDANGFRHTFNTSFTVTVEPYIELVLSDVKAKWEGGTLKLSGTITNLGNAQAQRVMAYAKVGNRLSEGSFVGDIDPSSQSSFSIVMSDLPPTKSVKLIITYYDPFNEEHNITRIYGVKLIVLNTTTTAKAAGPLSFITGGKPTLERYIIIGLVAAFLILVWLAIRSYLRRHSARPLEGLEGLEGLAEGGGEGEGSGGGGGSS